MCSLQDLPLRKPVFSLRISLCRVAVKSSSMTLLDFLLLRLKRVKRLQLFESNRSRSSKTFTIRPVFQSSSMFLDIQISQKNFERIVKVRDFSGSTRSALMPSAPGAFPFFILLIALLISSIHGGSVFLAMCCVSARISAVCQIQGG